MNRKGYKSSIENNDFLEFIKTYYRKKDSILGILYYPSKTISFSNIKNEEDLNKLGIPEMVYLKSKLTNKELEVYRNNFTNFNEKNISIKLS